MVILTKVVASGIVLIAVVLMCLCGMKQDDSKTSKSILAILLKLLVVTDTVAATVLILWCVWTM
jgi:hypothetical protein